MKYLQRKQLLRESAYAGEVKDLIGAAFGFGLIAFGLLTSRDNHILVGTLTAVAFLVLYSQERKRQRSEDQPPDDPNG